MSGDTRALYRPETWETIGRHESVEIKGERAGAEMTVAYCHACRQANVVVWFERFPCDPGAEPRR